MKLAKKKAEAIAIQRAREAQEANQRALSEQLAREKAEKRAQQAQEEAEKSRLALQVSHVIQIFDLP